MAPTLDLVWSSTKSNLKDWYRTVVRAGTAAYALPVIALQALFLGLFSDQLAAFFNSLAALPEQPTGAQVWEVFGALDTTLVAGGILFALISFALTLVFYAGMLRTIVKDDKPTVSSFLHAGRSNALRLLGYVIVVCCLLFLLTLALILPALIFAVFWSVASIVFFKERGVLNALSKSFQLVKGHWWRTCGYVVLLLIASILASSVIEPVRAMLTGLSVSSPALGLGLSGVLDTLWVLLVSPLYVAYTKGIYDALSEPALAAEEDDQA